MGPTFTWFRMDSFCGQMEEYASGHWDLAHGELQLYPHGGSTQTSLPNMAASSVKLQDGTLVLTMNGKSSPMTHDPSHRN